MVKTMAKLRMAHASMHGARKPPGPKTAELDIYSNSCKSEFLLKTPDTVIAAKSKKSELLVNHCDVIILALNRVLWLAVLYRLEINTLQLTLPGHL